MTNTTFCPQSCSLLSFLFPEGYVGVKHQKKERLEMGFGSEKNEMGGEGE